MADNPVLPTYILPNTPDPSEAVRKNVELVVGIQNARQQQQLHNLQAQEIQQKLGQQQIAQERQKNANADIAALGPNPSTDQIAKLSIKYPELKDHFKQSFDMLSTTEKEASVSLAMKVHNALATGDMKIAAKVASEAGEAFRNHNQADRADAMDSIAKQALSNPGGAKLATGLFLSHAMGAAEYKQAMSTPAEIRKEEAAAKLGEFNVSPEHLALGEDKARADIFQARQTGAAQGAEAGYKGEQTKELKELAPNKLKQSDIATKTAEIEGAQAEPRAQATTKKLRGEADSSAAEGKFAEAMRLANLNSSQMDNVLKQFKVINAPQVAAAEASSARAEADKKQADAIVAGEQARTAKETADQQLERLKLDNSQVRQNISKLPEPAQARASELTDAGLVDYTAAKNIAAIKDAVTDVKAGLGSAGFPADFSSWARTKTGYDGKYEQLKFLYNQLTSDKKLRSASSHGAAAIIALRNTNFPPFSAGRDVIVPLLEKMQAAYQESADVNNVKADFQSQNGGDPDIAKKDFVAGGRIVRAGDRLRDVIERPSKVDEARQIIKKMGKDSPDAKALTAKYAKLGFRL